MYIFICMFLCINLSVLYLYSFSCYYCVYHASSRTGFVQVRLFPPLVCRLTTNFVGSILISSYLLKCEVFPQKFHMHVHEQLCEMNTCKQVSFKISRDAKNKCNVYPLSIFGEEIFRRTQPYYTFILSTSCEERTKGSRYNCNWHSLNSNRRDHLGRNEWTALVADEASGHLLLNPRHKLYSSIIPLVPPQGFTACSSFVGPRGNTKTRHGVIPHRREAQQCNSLFLFNVLISECFALTVCVQTLWIYFIGTRNN
jgi:hypothetical protein